MTSLSVIAAGAEPCKENPKVAEACFETRGRVYLANGTPAVRIWKVGTKRVFGVLYSEREILPENLSKHLGWDHLIYGDFVLCPFTEEQPGWMQMGCVESAKNLRVEDRGKTGKDRIIYSGN